MTPAARLSAAIEVLDQLAVGAQPADRALKAWGKSHRFAGSGDRRAVTERVYACLRERGRLAAMMEADSGRALVLASLGLLDRLDGEAIAALFNGESHGPAPLTSDERRRLESLGQGDGLGLPVYIEGQLLASFGEAWAREAAALLRGRAALDIRVNDARGAVIDVEAVLADAGIRAARTPLSALGLRIEGSPDLTAMPAFAEGRFEIQDEGSQVAAFLAGADASGLIVDYCAGGGGKTLALAQRLRRGDGRILACDVDVRRLEAIKPRLKRAGVSAEFRRLGEAGEGVDDLAGLAGLVLADAPCSASGTWRRRPEAAWRLTETEVERLAALQSAILDRAARLVAPGGRLAYVTCSVLQAENGAVADAFAAAHPEFRPVTITVAAATAPLTDEGRARLAALSGGGHKVQLSPLRTQTDGFFIALFERSA